jgi:hypothetical protein
MTSSPIVSKNSKTLVGILFSQIAISFIMASPVYFLFKSTFYVFVNTQLENFFKGEEFFILASYFLLSAVLAIVLILCKCNWQFLRMLTGDLSGAFVNYLQVMLGILLYFIIITLLDPRFHVNLHIAIGLYCFLIIVLILCVLLMSSTLIRDVIILRPATESQLAMVKTFSLVIVKWFKKVFTRK